jgi:hypothetical protein
MICTTSYVTMPHVHFSLRDTTYELGLREPNLELKSGRADYRSNVRGGGYQWSGILVPVPYHGIIPFYVSKIALSHASFALL